MKKAYLAGAILIVACAAAALFWFRAPPKGISSLSSAIAAKCGTPPEWVKVGAGDEVHFTPPPEAEYDKVECAVRELQAHSISKMGFVGSFNAED